MCNNDRQHLEAFTKWWEDREVFCMHYLHYPVKVGQGQREQRQDMVLQDGIRSKAYITKSFMPYQGFLTYF